MTRVFANPRVAGGAVVAGIAAGCSIVVCFAFMNLAVLHVPGFTLAGFFAYDASALVGSVAYSSGSYIVLGVALHFAVSIGWSLGYAVLAERQRQLVTQPWISGAAFGLLVYFAMQLVLVGASLYRIPTPGELGVALLAHLVFWGIPLALIVARTQRAG